MNETAPPSVIRPGLVRKYCNTSVIEQYQINLKLSSDYVGFNSNQRLNIYTTELGSNIYTQEKKSNEKKETQDNLNSHYDNNIQENDPDNIEQKVFSEEKSNTKNVSKYDYSNTNDYLKNDDGRKENIQLIKKEYGHLADLLTVKNSDESNTFKLDLFKRKFTSNLKYQSNQSEDEDNDFIEIEREGNFNNIKQIFDEIKISESNNEQQDDLLDLMDMVSNK